jgi:holo-ACP synthase / triphosphoribosyl-dephospho-CoA synthase
MKKVSLEEVMAYREKRLHRRQELLSEYALPLACLGLNIPGEYKDFPWARRCFHEEIEAFKLALEAEGLAISYEERKEESAGYTAYVSVDSGPETLKALALRLEDTHPLGRLFDIDIHEPGGTKLSRQGTRQCLVCTESAFVCARSRAHTLEELSAALLNIMENFFRQKLSDKVCSAALWAMMSEAAITPKPGLVDRANNGAHTDMDFFTFIDSSSVLLPWFRTCALAGFNSEGGVSDSGTDPLALFQSLRPPGKEAELLMSKATGDVNAHRGYIFSLGILSAAYGRLYRNEEKPDLVAVIEFVKAMTATVEADFADSRAEEGSAKKFSHGEAVYNKSGIRGIRGEVSRGFPSVINHALPLLNTLLNEGYSLNDAGVAVLLKLLAYAEDTNLIHRGSVKILGALQEELKSFFAEKADMKRIKEKAAALDKDFISRGLSPGGSADLLGVTLFLFRLF